MTTHPRRVLTPAEAARKRWANTDAQAIRAARLRVTEPGRLAAARTNAQRFEDLVDPERVLSIEEREQRAAAVKREHYRRLGKRSGAARRQARDSRGDAA